MDLNERTARRADKALRREAALWFARLRGPQAQKHQREFDAWRAADPSRQAAYDRLIRRWDEAAVLVGPRAVGASLAPDRTRRLTARRRPSSWGWAGLAAGFALIAIFILPERGDWLDQWPIPSAWSQRLTTGVGEIRQVRLADGSTVTLDTDTVLRARISPSMRALRLLRGRARFDVAHDPARPFIVAVGGGAVAARGTLFDITLSPDQRVSVTLMRGAVDVEPPKSSGRRAGRPTTVRLAPGQALAFDHSRSAPLIRPAAPSAVLWPSGRLSFEDTPLSEALAEANRYSRRRIVLAPADLGRLRVSGVFQATAPRALAETLAATFDLQLQTGPGGAFELSAPTATTARASSPSAP